MLFHFIDLVCKECNVGTYVKKGNGTSIADCKVCPEGTNKKLLAGYRACFCLDNYARTDRFGPCYPCSEREGVVCSGGYKTIKPGYFWSWEFDGANISHYKNFVANLQNESLVSSRDHPHTKYVMKIPRAFKCTPSENCVNANSSIEVTCRDGFNRWLCSKCDKNYYPVLENCFKCPSKVRFVLETIIILSATTVIVTVIIFCISRRKNI